MKNLIIVMLFISGLSFAQETHTFKSGGRVFENGKRLTSADVETSFNHKPEIMKLYNNGRNRKTVGNILFWSAIGTGVIKFISDTNEPITSDNRGNVYAKQTSNVLYFVTGSMVLIAIPIKIGFQKKIKKSILLMNEEIKSQKQDTGLNLETNIIANTNGVGLKITF